MAESSTVIEVNDQATFWDVIITYIMIRLEEDDEFTEGFDCHTDKLVGIFNLRHKPIDIEANRSIAEAMFNINIRQMDSVERKYCRSIANKFGNFNPLVGQTFLQSCMAYMYVEKNFGWRLFSGITEFVALIVGHLVNQEMFDKVHDVVCLWNTYSIGNPLRDIGNLQQWISKKGWVELVREAENQKPIPILKIDLTVTVPNNFVPFQTNIILPAGLSGEKKEEMIQKNMLKTLYHNEFPCGIDLCEESFGTQKMLRKHQKDSHIGKDSITVQGATPFDELVRAAETVLNPEIQKHSTPASPAGTTTSPAGTPASPAGAATSPVGTPASPAGTVASEVPAKAIEVKMIFACNQVGCGAMFLTKQQFKEHSESAHTEETPPDAEVNKFTCPDKFCLKKFPSRPEMQTHLLQAHNYMSCQFPECAFSTPTMGYLKSHMTMEHAKPLKCKCGAVHKMSLYECNGCKKYCCKLCKCFFSFKDLKGLQAHYDTTHPSVQEKLVGTDEDENSDKKCSFPGCGVAFEHLDYLKQHLAHAHAVTPPVDPTKCECGLAKVHGEGPCLKCKKCWCRIGNCDFITTNAKNLKGHQTAIHPNNPVEHKSIVSLVNCNFPNCIKQFNKSQALYIHQNASHGAAVAADELAKCSCGSVRCHSIGPCKTCGAIWCPRPNCTAEVKDIQQLDIHQIENHFSLITEKIVCTCGRPLNDGNCPNEWCPKYKN